MPGPVSQSYEGPSDVILFPPRWSMPHLTDGEYARLAAEYYRKLGVDMSSNEHPDMSGSGCDEDYYSDEEVSNREHTAFIAGAQQMREMLSRFVEHGPDSPAHVIAKSMRLNWVPSWGNDPGEPEYVHDTIDAALP